MKTLRIILVLALASPALWLTPGCSTPPSERVVQVQTLKAVGHSAEGVVALSARLYQQRVITAEQARQVMDFYDLKFQPAFRVAVAAVQGNLDSIASPDLVSLAAQLSDLLIQFQNANKKPSP